jgi:peroxiredoxin
VSTSAGPLGVDSEAPSADAVEEALASLPDLPLSDLTATGAAFRSVGIARFHDAVRLVWRLPYGRNADRADWRLVLPEGRGTCSTKHALLARLAREHGVRVDLVVGIYEMREANTPGVGATLSRHGLDALPEAHCYLRIGRTRLDVTRADAAADEPIERFLSQTVIEPAEIGERKLAIHRAAMETWIRERLPEWTADGAWRVREACIGALTRRRSVAPTLPASPAQAGLGFYGSPGVQAEGDCGAIYEPAPYVVRCGDATRDRIIHSPPPEHPMAATPSTMLELGTPAPAFALPDTEGRTYSLDDFRQANALLVMFICNHCPFVKHIRGALAQLGRDYGPAELAIAAINANDAETYPRDGPAAMKAEKADAGYPFPYLYDESQQTAAAYRAACTPDFFLFDGERRLVYRGQFDASRPGNGVPVTGGDLRGAIDAVLAGRPVAAGQVPSIGCGIKWKPGNEPGRLG